MERNQCRERTNGDFLTFAAPIINGKPTRELGFLGCMKLTESVFQHAHGVPGGIRTHGPQIRNLVLYPAELRRRTTAL